MGAAGRGEEKRLAKISFARCRLPTGRNFQMVEGNGFCFK